jgi:hypothetical protein
MAMKFANTETLKALITHHIALIDRFNADSFEEFALLFLKMDDYDNMEIKKSIQIIFRDSDIIFEESQNYIILLPKTNWNGAIELLNGLQEFLNQKLQDSIVTYPDDGENAQTLLTEFESVVEKAYSINLKLSL